MPARPLLPVLLLCVLLLPWAQGGPRARSRTHDTEPVTEVRACKERVKVHACRRHCEDHRECQANSICCSAFCGNVCMSLL